MICTQCGNLLTGSAKLCPGCGAPAVITPNVIGATVAASVSGKLTGASGYGKQEPTVRKIAMALGLPLGFCTMCIGVLALVDDKDPIGLVMFIIGAIPFGLAAREARRARMATTQQTINGAQVAPIGVSDSSVASQRTTRSSRYFRARDIFKPVSGIVGLLIIGHALHLDDNLTFLDRSPHIDTSSKEAVEKPMRPRSSHESPAEYAHVEHAYGGYPVARTTAHEQERSDRSAIGDGICVRDLNRQSWSPVSLPCR